MKYMGKSSLDWIIRRNKLASLSNVVLLGGRAMEDPKHLEKKIAERINKEFPDPSSREEEIISGLRESNLRFVERKIKQMNDKELFVQIGANVREKDVHLFYKFDDPNLSSMELFVMGDALMRSGVRSITTYLPYIPYQRQDKKDDGRVPISAKLFFNLLKTSMGDRLKRIVTYDLHAKQAQAHFDGPMDELSAVPEFAAYYSLLFKEDLNSSDPKVKVITPDAGGAKRARILAKLLDIQYLVLDKARTGHGKAEHNFYLPADVRGVKTIVVDDIIDSAGSLVGEFENDKQGPIQYLQSRGAEVYVCATHRLLSEKNEISAEKRLAKVNVPVLFTDSLSEKYPRYFEEHEWMSVLSLDYVQAKAFFCNQVGSSISDFLRGREERLYGRKIDFVVKQGNNGLVEVED